ncbi:preprotein translocase subunit YajC [Streptacidiphilus albus]|uniref:preprotein translocase subunit YajC n=1 Tax=Streptacidiphilus albus TaxID=105425 RepID=UPI0005A8998B|nr:preprotein translocase subunit YajC [Streptacidiphilus albus]
MNPIFLFLILAFGGLMIMSTRSGKKKQQAAIEMRNKMEPGVGVRTIGGMYALVKSVTEEAVELEVAPGVYALYAKNAIAVVMDGVEYNRIVHGDEDEEDAEGVEDDADVAAGEAEDEAVVLDKAEQTDADSAADEAKADEGKADGDKIAFSK